MRFSGQLLFLLFALAADAVAGPRPALSRPSLVAPVFVDEQMREQAWVFPDSRDELFFIEAEPLILSLAEELTAEKIEALRKRVDAKKLISLKAVHEEGILGEFNQLSLELRLSVPAQARRVTTRSVVHRGSSPNGNTHGPAAFSGYLNARVSQPFLYPPAGQQRSRLPLLSNLAFTSNLHSWAVISGATYTERDDFPWKREDTAVVHDFENKMLRLTVGDQQSPSTSYLSSRNIAGLGLTRVFGIQPHETTQPVSRTELLLKRPSSVDVLVNGVVQNQMRLPAGPVNVQDFPLASGFNNVALRITDDLGRTEIINLSLFYNPESLGKGVHLFSYHVGVPWRPVRADRTYDHKDVNYSFFHRTGLSDVFTGGLSAQGNNQQKLAGLDGLWVGRLGTSSFTVAGSQINRGKSDLAGRLRLESLDSSHGQIFPWRFSFESEYKGWDFVQVGSTVPANLFSWTGDLYALYRSRRNVDFGLGTGYRFKRTNPVDRWEGRSDISTLLWRDFRFSVNYAYTKDIERVHRVFFSLTWIEPSGRHYVNSSYDYPSKVGRIDAVRNPAQSFDDIRLAAGVARSPDTHQASLQAEYIAQRALVRLDHQSNFSRTQQTGTRHITTAGMSTALAWAGSSISLSRPISDSFVILPSRGAARGQEILVNPQGDSAETYAGGFLPGVLPNVSPYYYTPVSLDASRMPLGMTIPEEYFQVKNTYKSGTEFTVGAEFYTTAIGTLVLKNGKPLALASGEIVAEGAASGEVFFTNKKGQFVAENIRPGTYALQFYEGDYAPVKFKIPEAKPGIYRLGELKVLKGSGR